MIPCPMCADTTLTVEALFTCLRLDCYACSWHRRVDVTDALRAPLHAVIVAAVAKLRADYGLVIPPEQTQEWLADPNPLEALHTLEGVLHDAARAYAGNLLPWPVNVTAWTRARDAASEDIKDWLAVRLYQTVLAADEARALSEAA